MKQSSGQVRDVYIRVVATIYTALAGLIGALATLMLIAAVADHMFGFGWGFDFDHAWILLIVNATSAVLLLVGRAIFRIVGALR